MAVKDLVSGVLTESITTSTTNILVNVAQGISASEIQSLFPTPPFYITIMPKSPTVGVSNRLDSEILQVTAVGSDQSGNASLTCVRGQRDTTAKAFSAGDIVTVGVYAEDAVFLGGEGSAVETPSPWIESSDIKNGAVTSDKIDWTTSGYKTGTANTASSSIVDKIVLSGLDTSATYLALGEIWVNNTSGSVKDFDAYITGLTTEEHIQTTQLWWNNFSFHSVIKPNNDAEIKLRYNSNGIAPNRARLTVIRIG